MNTVVILMTTTNHGSALGAGYTSSLAQLAQKSDTSFPQLLKMLRERAGLSARALSSKCGFSPSYVSKAEAGILVPTLDNFARLVNTLGCSDQEIVFLVRSLAPNQLEHP
jgi:hypothetical protein